MEDIKLLLQSIFPYLKKENFEFCCWLDSGVSAIGAAGGYWTDSEMLS